MSEQTLIYVDVKSALVKHWTPVQAVHVHGSCYKVLESSSDPEHWIWEFEEGDTVRCEVYEFAEGETGLVARARCECVF